MRKRSLLAILVLALWAFSILSACPIAAGDGDWTAEIAVGEETIYPKTDIGVEVTYTYRGATPVPADADCKFHLEIRALTSAAEAIQKSEEVDVPEAPGTATGETFSVGSQIAAPAEGNYTLVAILTVNGETVESSQPLAVQTALPPGLARLFAGLAMFAAMMAILAVGTEVLIDSVKVFVGLKEKVTALEALDLLKKELPGQLTALGVSAASQAQIDKLFEQVDAAQDWLEQTLQPLATAGEVYNNVQAGRFSAAFGGMQSLEDEIRELQRQLGTATNPTQQKALQDGMETRLQAMKQIARDGVAKVLDALQRTLKLDQAALAQVKKAVLALIDGVTVPTILSAADYTAAWVGRIFQEIGKNGADWTANWLKAQARTYVETGGSQVMLLVNNNVVPLLTDLGFAPDNVQAVRSGIQAQVDRLKLVLDEKAATYTQAVRNLLQAVEERRNQMQSPLRKFWRWLRRTDQVSAGAVLVGIALVIAILVAAPLLRWPASWALIACLVAFVICMLIGRGRTPTFGQGVTQLEQAVNVMLGREQRVQFLGEVAADVSLAIDDIDPTTVAAVLLQREDKHQDEEASRLRVLRIISVLVGGTLAYALQVDALKLLDEALPGAAQVNLRLLPAGKLLWFTLRHELRAGIILTGLAAAAGSKFWRDLLGRLEATKEQAESAAVLLRRAKGALGVEEEK